MIACNDYNYFEMTYVITITEYPRNSLLSAVSHSKIIYKKNQISSYYLKLCFLSCQKNMLVHIEIY